ncbi:DUF167 domain-containing protein [Novosphingobium sp.]|uniref:DUF167 domain-containing protein n=1 Tax=Novosphingobium sp. TaxID=1874826 RepID=UPI0028AFD246|nr:DUF167 domain-containing protein [Novosphingobium sp.]
MAKPKVMLPPSDALRALIDGEGRLSVRVTPGVKVEALEIVDARVLVKVRAKPEDGKANEAVRALLSVALDVAVSRISLLRGATSREKQFHVEL